MDDSTGGGCAWRRRDGGARAATCNDGGHNARRQWRRWQRPPLRPIPPSPFFFVLRFFSKRQLHPEV
uniref:Uncharacterized protein n=1 Tax=Oryza sativa subsp. japonica TaxID=39947 RepID=Q8LGY4_ORYSJ|nr:hypothetical protein [Oryza sativa Japonica Group]